MSSKIFVTGGSGFIGSSICKAALSTGYEVISLSRSGRPDISETWVDSVQWLSASVFEVEKWQDYVQGCDVVVHSIGIIIERSDDETYQRINRESAIIVADRAAAANARKFIYVSVSKKPPFIPNAYLTTKRQAEEALQSYPFECAILRPGAVYGSRRWWSYILKVIFDLRAMLLRKADSPMSVTELGQAVMAVAADSTLTGVIDVPTLKKLA